MNHRHFIVETTGVFGILLFCLGMAACEILDPNPGPEPFTVGNAPADTTGEHVEPRVDTVPPSVARGADIFLQYCSRCHGIDASGTIYSRGSIQGKKGIHLTVRQGRGGMPSFPDLSDNEIESVELWLGTFDVGLEDADGEELYLFYCSGCHGGDALGGRTFSGSIQGYDPIGHVVRAGLGEMPAIDITEAQIESIQAYLNGFMVDYSKLSGREYYSRVCAACHGDAGEGSSRGPDIRNPVIEHATWVVRNGRSGHPSFSRTMPRYTPDSLLPSQLSEILAWLVEASKPFTGEELYNRYCSTCHGFDGRGGVSEKRIDDKGFKDFLEKIREGENDGEYGSRTEYMPSRTAVELSDSEVRRIAEWITR